MILADTGPLIALIDQRDRHHPACMDALRALTEQLGTVWPVLTEAMFFLPPQGQDTLWQMIEGGSLGLIPLDLADVHGIRQLMRKYADLPMDLADAALIRVAEREGIHTIFTLDRRDFSVYRIHGRIRPSLIP